MLNWISEERAAIAAILILLLIISFVVSIFIGVKQTAFRQKDEVFGDPERTLGGWYWTVTGVSTILLLWFYFSWGVGRAFFPDSGNEMCQIAKLETALAPITAALPMNSRYYKSTTLIKRNNELLNILQRELPVDVFTKEEQSDLNKIIANSQKIIGVFSSKKNQSTDSKVKLEEVNLELSKLSRQLRSGFSNLKPTKESLQQAKWGTTYTEIPLLPITPKGVLFDNVSNQAKTITKTFLRTRNNSTAADDLINATKETISKLKNINKSSKFEEDVLEKRFNYLKAVERIFKRLDDGTIFPPQALDKLTLSLTGLFSAVDETKGSLKLIDILFIPGDGVVK